MVLVDVENEEHLDCSQLSVGHCHVQQAVAQCLHAHVDATTMTMTMTDLMVSK